MIILFIGMLLVSRLEMKSMRLRSIRLKGRRWKAFGIEGMFVLSHPYRQFILCVLCYCSYVVCTTRRPPVTWTLSVDPSSSSTSKAPKTEEPQQVFIGIFPASHIHVRDELSDAEGRLPDFAASLQSGTNGISNGTDSFAQWKQDKANAAMDPVKEEEEENDPARKSFRLG